MRTKLLLVLSAMLLFGSCNKDSITELTLNFKLEYGGEPLVFFEELTYPDGRDFEFTRLSFYISDISINDSSESILIKDVDYIDLTSSHSSLEGAQNGFDYTINLDEEFSYEGLEFNLGLNPSQNSTSPQDHNSSSALSLTGEYWSNWSSYVFVKVEGRLDLDNDGISDGIAFHLGSNDAMRNIKFQDLNSDSKISIVIDAKNIFENAGVIYDIDANPRIHSLNQLDQINQLMDNFKSSLIIRK